MGGFARGALFVIVIVFGVEVARKGGKKIVDAVSTLCKDVYNYIKNRFRKNSANDEKVTNDATINETDELLQPIKAEDKTCNDYMNVEKPKALVDGLIYKGESNLFFSPANTGKSIYALQIAIETAKKYPNCNVVYFNQEMSDSQMCNRLFPEGINVPDDYYPLNLSFKYRQMNSEMFIKSLLDCIPEGNSEMFVILDNITHLCSSPQSNDATNLINKLSIIRQNAQFKRGVTITFLLVSHTLKGYHELLSEQDCKGKSGIFDIVDAAFAIGKTRDENRYIVKLKQRNDEFSTKRLYIHKIVNGNNDKPYLHMEFIKEEDADIVFPSKRSMANSKPMQEIKGHQGKKFVFNAEKWQYIVEQFKNNICTREAAKNYTVRFNEPICHTTISKYFKEFKKGNMGMPLVI